MGLPVHPLRWKTSSPIQSLVINEPEPIYQLTKSNQTGPRIESKINIYISSLLPFSLSHFASPTQDIAANMTVESTAAVPNGDASNGNIIPSSKKSRESDRRRRRRKQKKNSKAASRADSEEADVSGASDSKENADPQPQVSFVSSFFHSIHGIGDFLGFLIFFFSSLSRLRSSMFQSSLNSKMALAMSSSKSLRSSVSRNLLPLR